MTQTREEAELDAIDPRKMPRQKLTNMGFKKKSLLGVMREKCYECCSTFYEVRCCASSTCPLWPYRLGTDPFSGRKGNLKSIEVINNIRKEKIIVKN